MRIILAFTLCFAFFFGIEAQDKKKPKAQLIPLQSLTDDGITGKVKSKIIQHIKDNLSKQTVEFILSSNKDGERDLIVSELNSAPFTQHVKFYFLRHRGFSHWSEIYADYNGKLYTSLKKEDFENFLRDYDFTNKADSLNLFIAAYINFNIKSSAIHPEYVMTDNYLKKDLQNLEKYQSGNSKLSFEEIHSPKEKKGGSKMEISFFVANPSLKKIIYRKVSVSPSYSFQWKSKIYTQN